VPTRVCRAVSTPCLYCKHRCTGELLEEIPHHLRVVVVIAAIDSKGIPKVSF